MKEALIGPLNSFFGSSPPPRKKNPDEKVFYGVHDPTKEEFEKEKSKLTPEELCARDFNCLQPNAAYRAAVFFGGMFLIIIMVIWFYCTCKNNRQRHKYESNSRNEGVNELSRFQPQNQNEF